MSDPQSFDRANPVPDPTPPSASATPGDTAADGEWQASWETEDNYWHENFSSRPYALGPDFYDRFRPAYRYGYESGAQGAGRRWDDAEPDLRTGWEQYRQREGQDSTWDDIKDAVRDAWDRVTGNRTAESESRRPQ